MSTEPTANILIVDDDPESLAGMESLVAGRGRKIVTASSGHDALQQLRQDFALILLDVRMPDMDGFETADLIRRNESLRHIPIVFLSTIDTLETDVYRGAADGIDYLFKPLVPEILKAKVSVFVELFQNQRLKATTIRESEERFRSLVENMKDYAIFMLDSDGRVTSWNAGAERILGFHREEILGERFSRFYTPEEQALPNEALTCAASEGRSEQEGCRLRKDGTRFWANTIVSALLDESQNLIGFSVVMRDLAERRQAEEALRESEENLRRQAEDLEQQLIASGRLVSLGEITASMAHELNNPLGIVMGFAQDLLTETDPTNPHYGYLKIIDEETKRCQKIIQDLLQFASPSAAELRPIDVQDIIVTATHLLENRLYRQNIELSLNLAEALPPVDGDAQQLEQALISLCLNAIDAMPQGGRLVLEAKVLPTYNGDPPMLVVIVGDTGFGIDEENQAKIFLPFFTAKKTKGLGLGLPICERIVKNHRGRIEFTSQPAQGTSFRIYLPLSGPVAKPTNQVLTESLAESKRAS